VYKTKPWLQKYTPALAICKLQKINSEYRNMGFVMTPEDKE
jgi:hypothetical protein